METQTKSPFLCEIQNGEEKEETAISRQVASSWKDTKNQWQREMWSMFGGV